MTSCVFAFGSGDAWFFETPSMWKWGDLPPVILNRFKDSAGDRKAVHVHSLTFGANGSYLMTWKGKDGRNYQDHAGLPASLAAWLDKTNAKGFLTRSVPNIRLALGPGNASYWVTDGDSFSWLNLPQGLNTAIQKLRGRDGRFTNAPRLVSLGVAGTYFMITSANGASWSLGNSYPDLEAWISRRKAEWGNKGGMLANVTNLSLDGFDAGNYVLTTVGGGYNAWMPGEAQESFVAVAKTLPNSTPARHKQAHHSGLGNVGGILKLASLVLNAEANMANGGGGGNNAGGGGGFNFTPPANNFDFTQGLQNQTWSSVDNAATNWNVQ